MGDKINNDDRPINMFSSCPSMFDLSKIIDRFMPVIDTIDNITLYCAASYNYNRTRISSNAISKYTHNGETYSCAGMFEQGLRSELGPTDGFRGLICQSSREGMEFCGVLYNNCYVGVIMKHNNVSFIG
jgi:hypothetical protein